MCKDGLRNRLSLMQTQVADQPQIFDLLQLSCIERRAREDFIRAMADIRDWKNYVAARSFEIPERIVRMQSARLRRSARDAARDYKNARSCRTKIFQKYMEELPAVGISKRLAS